MSPTNCSSSVLVWTLDYTGNASGELYFFAWLILLATFSSTVLSSAATSLFDINSNATQHLRWRNTMLSPSHSSTTLDPSSSSLTLALRINSKTRLGEIAQNNDNNSTEWQSWTSTKANYPCQGNKLIQYLSYSFFNLCFRFDLTFWSSPQNSCSMITATAQDTMALNDFGNRQQLRQNKAISRVLHLFFIAIYKLCG